MKKQHSKNIFAFIIAIVFTLILAGCNPRNLPGFRQITEQQDTRARKLAEEKIEKEPVFRELNQLCTKEIPLYKGFSLVSLDGVWWNKRNFLTYLYFSNADWRNVKAFYKDYFAQNGWSLIDEYDTSWGSSKVEVKKGSYRVILFNEGLGDNANYAFHCEKLFDSYKVN